MLNINVIISFYFITKDNFTLPVLPIRVSQTHPFYQHYHGQFYIPRSPNQGFPDAPVLPAVPADQGLRGGRHAHRRGRGVQGVILQGQQTGAVYPLWIAYTRIL